MSAGCRDVSFRLERRVRRLHRLFQQRNGNRGLSLALRNLGQRGERHAHESLELRDTGIQLTQRLHRRERRLFVTTCLGQPIQMHQRGSRVVLRRRFVDAEIGVGRRRRLQGGEDAHRLHAGIERALVVATLQQVFRVLVIRHAEPATDVGRRPRMRHLLQRLDGLAHVTRAAHLIRRRAKNLVAVVHVVDRGEIPIFRSGLRRQPLPSLQPRAFGIGQRRLDLTDRPEHIAEAVVELLDLERRAIAPCGEVAACSSSVSAF